MNILPTLDDGSDATSAERLAVLLGALSHPARIEILKHLASADCRCCKDVVGRFDLAQSTVSQHLKVLVAAGLVKVKADRQRSIYNLDRAALAEARLGLTDLAEFCCADEEFTNSCLGQKTAD